MFDLHQTLRWHCKIGLLPMLGSLFPIHHTLTIPSAIVSCRDHISSHTASSFLHNSSNISVVHGKATITCRQHPFRPTLESHYRPTGWAGPQSPNPSGLRVQNGFLSPQKHVAKGFRSDSKICIGAHWHCIGDTQVQMAVGIRLVELQWDNASFNAVRGR